MDASHVYVHAWVLGYFYSHISTRTFRRALTASVDSCAEIKSAPSVGRVWRKVPESGARSVCSDRYIISLSPHLHTPFPPFSPSLINIMASVDVKHHVSLLMTRARDPFSLKKQNKLKQQQQQPQQNKKQNKTNKQTNKKAQETQDVN